MVCLFVLMLYMMCLFVLMLVYGVFVCFDVCVWWFVCFNALHPCQQFFSHFGTIFLVELVLSSR